MAIQGSLNTHHYTGGHGNTSTAVSVRHNVTEADAQEGYGYQPHGVQEVRVLLVVEPATNIPVIHICVGIPSVPTNFHLIYAANFG